MREVIARQWSNRMVASCANTHSTVRYNRRKGAPTSIILPEPQLVASSGKRSWTSCLKSCLSPRGSRDSGFYDNDYQISPHDGFHQHSARNSSFATIKTPSIKSWPFEIKTENQSPRSYTAKPVSARENRRNSAYFGSHPSSPIVSPIVNHFESKAKHDVHSAGHSLPAMDTLCSRVRASMHFVEAPGESNPTRSRASTIQTSLSATTSAHSSSTSLSSAPKRGRKSLDDEDELSDDQDRKGKKIRDQSPDQFAETSKLFACPFSKMDPARYSHQNINEQDYRNCATGYWKSIPRLKQHLYRCHDRSTFCCQRCWQSCMENKAFQKHVNSQKCEARPIPFEKMDLAKHQLIKGRSHGEPVALWYRIFEILFPNAPHPHSPFAELVIGVDLRDLVQSIRQDLPALLRNDLIECVQQSTREDTTVNEAVNVLINEKLPQALEMITTQFAESRAIEHVLPTNTSISTVSQTAESAPMVDVEPSMTTDVPLRTRPTGTLQRLLSQQSVLSSDTVTVTGHQNRSNLLLDLAGTAPWSQQAVFDPTDGQPQGYSEFGWSSDLPYHPPWGTSKAASLDPNNLVPTVVQNLYRFNEPGRPEYPFPRSISPSLTSTTQHETNSVALSHDDQSWYMVNDDHTWQHFDPSIQYNNHQQIYRDEQTNIQPSEHQISQGVLDFNSSSHITGMQTWF